jgi:hypothetical protein
LQHGDRIGHALALGIDVDHFLHGQPYAVERAEDRLENLIWEWSLYESGVLSAPRARRSRIETKIQELGREIYGVDVPLQVHVEARALRMKGWHLERWRDPRLYAPVATTPAEHILLSYLRDPAVYLNGQRPVHTSGQEDRDFLLQAQRMVRAQFRARHITIEANPSSNLLIGNFAEFAQLPIFRLAQPTPEGWVRWLARTLRGGLLRQAPDMTETATGTRRLMQPCEAELSVAIADDDPLTFATSLHQEFVYAHMALQKSGYTDKDALVWLERRRRESIAGRFTLAASRSKTPEPG